MKTEIKTFVLLLLLASFEDVIGQTYSGDLTYYYEWNGGYGSCGLERSRSDAFYVVALSTFWMKLPPGMTNPNNHPRCAPTECIQIYGAKGSVVLKISDTCMGCKQNDVDVADTVFPYLDDLYKGRVRVTWKFVDCRWNPPGRR